MKDTLEHLKTFEELKEHFVKKMTLDLNKKNNRDDNAKLYETEWLCTQIDAEVLATIILESRKQTKTN